MAKISASDVAKLRKMTGAGMMDCKNALTETEGNFDTAIDLLRKKGQKIANKRSEREASEGAVIAKVSSDNKKAVVIALNCETDFVAKNDDFVNFANEIATAAAENNVNSLEELGNVVLNGKTIAEEVMNKTGIIGEKVELSYFTKVEAEYVTGYIHLGNKLATLVGFSKALDALSARDIAMQVAAMNPIAVDQAGVSEEIIAKEIEIGKDQAIQEGKPADLAEKIAKGRLNKFFKENTLNNQQFIKDNKQTVADFLKGVDSGVNITEFKRFAIG